MGLYCDCEDAPCCGHTEGDPGRREWYDDPVQMSEYVSIHLYCDHEAGMYDCAERDDDDVDPETCEHGDTGTWKGQHFCDICESRLVMVTDVSPLAYPSKAVPGLWVEISVLGWHFEVA